MHPDLAKLMDLQKLDTEARRLREEIAALPKLVAQLDTKARAVAGQRSVVLNLIAGEEALRRRQESDIQDRQAKSTRARKQMETATTAVQVSAYEHEIAFNEAEVAKLEEAELESMERSDELEKQRRVADEAVATATQKHAAETLRATTVVTADITALAALDIQRNTQRALLGEHALSTYDRIARAKGTGIAEVWLQKCLACQMLVRPQRWNDLRERDNQEMMTCESCGRLLWYDPARDAPQRKPIEQESIAAQIVRGR